MFGNQPSVIVRGDKDLFFCCLKRVVFFLTACHALTLFLFSGLGCLDTSQFGIDENAAAILAHDDFLVHLDIQLALRRDFVEATSTRVTLYGDDTESVTGTLTDALERLQQAAFDFRF